MLEPLPNLTDGQLHRLIYSTWDFQQALSALTFLMEECDFEARYHRVELRKFRCYEASVIISFARPFEPSRGQTTIGLRAIGLQLNPEETRLKEAMLSLRRKVTAHSDEQVMHFMASTHQPLEDSPISFPLLQFNESLYIEVAQCRPLEALLRKLIAGIGKGLFALAQAEPERLNLYKQPYVANAEIQPVARADSRR